MRQIKPNEFSNCIYYLLRKNVVYACCEQYDGEYGVSKYFQPGDIIVVAGREVPVYFRQVDPEEG
jgi:hypothetical protein